MTDAEHATAARQHLEATTLAYPAWKQRAYQGEPGAKPDAKPRAGTAWAQALDHLAQIEAGSDGPTPGLDLYDLTLTPNWNNAADANDVANNYNAVWVWSNDALGYRPPNGRDRYRVLLLDPRATDAAGKAGADEWWFVIRRAWPPGYDPRAHGRFATHTSFHNVASQDGPSGGVGWGFGSGVSAILFQWRPQDATPSFGFEYVRSGGLVVPVPLPTPGQVHEYALRFVAGRLDGTTARPGELDVYADNAQVHESANVNTVQRAQAPGGTSYTQRWLAAAWDGDYGQDLAAPVSTSFVLTGAGRTLAEARANAPARVADTLTNQRWNGKPPNLGAPRLVP